MIVETPRFSPKLAAVYIKVELARAETVSKPRPLCDKSAKYSCMWDIVCNPAQKIRSHLNEGFSSHDPILFRHFVKFIHN